jgi:hypothetical protein
MITGLPFFHHSSSRGGWHYYGHDGRYKDKSYSKLKGGTKWVIDAVLDENIWEELFLGGKDFEEIQVDCEAKGGLSYSSAIKAEWQEDWMQLMHSVDVVKDMGANWSSKQNIKATEANRRRGPGTREKVRSKRINLEGNTHAQEINVSQCPV